MASNKKPSETTAPMTRKMVEEYLKANPTFLKDNPELFNHLAPPEKDLGDGVVDLQHYILGNLRKDYRSLQERYEDLVTSSRDNMSTLSQVHDAVVNLIKARDLEQLLETLTIDLARLFDVDVVRLSMESEVAEYYDNYYSEHTYSGITFITMGTVDALFREKDTMLCEDTAEQHLPLLEEIFADCVRLVESCALLRLDLPATQRQAILSFGVRHKGRFHKTQGTELLSFLARIVEHRLDQCLNETEMQKLR